MAGYLILGLWVFFPIIASSLLTVAFYTAVCILLPYILKNKIRNPHILGTVSFILPLIPILLLSNLLLRQPNYHIIFPVITAAILVITAVSFFIILEVKRFNLNSVALLAVGIFIAFGLSIMAFLYSQAFLAQSAVSSCEVKFQENPNYGVNEALLQEKYPLMGDSNGTYTFKLEFTNPRLERSVLGGINLSCIIERTLLITVYREGVEAVVLDSEVRIPLAYEANDKTFLEFVEQKVSDLYLEDINGELWIKERGNPQLDQGQRMQIKSGPYIYNGHNQKFISVNGGITWVKEGTAEFRELVR